MTVNEFVIGDINNWHTEEADKAPFADIGDLEIWYTDNPNGTWTKWEGVTATSFENLDNGLLWGTYAQGISFTGSDITGKYFILYDPDPQVGEFFFAVNYASPAVIYNPAA